MANNYNMTTMANSRPHNLMLLLQQNNRSTASINAAGGEEPMMMMMMHPHQQQTMSMLHFSPTHKMSLFSLEKRIDYHLSRIMKGHRLINFKNSIERLPAEKRICECIIEVLMSSLNLIARKTRIIAEAKALVDELNTIAHRSSLTINTVDDREEYLRKLKIIKTLAINLEQIVWALNSNKEHTKYIVKVFSVPDQYQRSEFSSDPNSIVPLKQSIIRTICECQEVINVCRILRRQIQDAVIDSFLAHFIN